MSLLAGSVLSVSSMLMDKLGFDYMHAIDVHAHWYPKRFLELISRGGAAHGVEWKEIEGKGPQFKVGHLVTGPLGPNFVDLDNRLKVMDEQGVQVHALS